MTDPQSFGGDPGNVEPQGNSGYPPPGQGYPPAGAQGYPPPGAAGYPPGYPPPAYPGAYPDPMAPYGRHPMTGEPLSDKSKTVGGLLQLLGLIGLVGIGRIYIGDTGLGVTQLIVGLITCGIGAVIWGVIDAVLFLTDKVRDPQGRPLRDGT